MQRNNKDGDLLDRLKAHFLGIGINEYRKRVFELKLQALVLRHPWFIQRFTRFILPWVAALITRMKGTQARSLFLDRLQVIAED